MSAPTLYKYRVFCNTDNVDKYVWSETEPTVCPENHTHSINTTKTRVVDIREPNSVILQEESVPTGGRFGCRTLKVTALANQTVTESVTYPFPISALSISFTTTEAHKGNVLEMAVNKNKIIGAITSAVAPATTYVSQNYVVGDKVLYTDSIGTRVYTCINNTVSQEIPTNKAFWILGYELAVSSTVTQYTEIGFFLKLDNLSQNDDMGRVIYKNTTTNKVYVENNPTNSYSPLTPTYVRQTIYMIKDYEIGEPTEHEIGQSKIGGAHIPPDTPITVDYTNNTNATSNIIGKVEFLY
jgi:hypothetical protein